MNSSIKTIAVAAMLVTFGACTASAKPADATKIAIDTIKKELGITVSCETPPDANVGTTFTCSGVDKDGTPVKFSAKMAKKDLVEVTQLPG
jgi:uncharacterized membrane protein